MRAGCLETETVMVLVDGGLAGPDLAAAESHVASCPACADLVAVAMGGRDLPPVPPAATLPRGAAIGRYLTLDLLGKGGMGEVYVAYDPQLDRKVALKLLHPQAAASGAEARVRLMREAKAIARLSHPNVVVVHDAGEVEGRVFLAMELVDGQTLAAWLAEKPRSWRETRDLFAAAARGLAAAHEAGLVHRDFKPQNVMVGKDGAVRVMDFGLASDQAGAGEPDDAAFGGKVGEEPLALTRTGILLGTPLYMAPEQFLGHRADARTDQFSFCVALYHALHGERPFPSESLPSLRDAVIAGRVRVPPEKPRVPAWLRKIVARGLQVDPAQRFESMGAVIEALGRDPARRYRRLAAAAAIAALVTAGAAGARWSAERGERLCQGASTRLGGIWETDVGGARRTAVERAFLATGRPFAADTWRRVAGILDDYARRWSAAYKDTCEAARAGGDQSKEVLDMRMTCLDGPRAALRALTDVFSRADGNVMVQAIDAANALPTLDRCADVAELRAGVALPHDATVRRRVEGARSQLADVKALTDTGKWAEARGRATALESEARATGYQPLIAEALEARALLETESGNADAATRAGQAAFLTGLAARRDDIALESAALLVGTLGYFLGRFEEAQRWDELGQALLDRLGPGHERAAGWLSQSRAGIAFNRGDFARQLAEGRQALALKQKALPPDHADIAISWAIIASARFESGDAAGALADEDEAIGIYRRAYGPQSLLQARELGNRADMLDALGRHAEAHAADEETLRRLTEFLGPDHLGLADPLTGLGNALRGEGRPGQAIPFLERALRLRERDEHTVPPAAATRFALARALWEAGGDRARARALATAARDGYRSAHWSARAAAVEEWLAAHR